MCKVKRRKSINRAHLSVLLQNIGRVLKMELEKPERFSVESIEFNRPNFDVLILGKQTAQTLFSVATVVEQLPSKCIQLKHLLSKWIGCITHINITSKEIIHTKKEFKFQRQNLKWKMKQPNQAHNQPNWQNNFRTEVKTKKATFYRLTFALVNVRRIQ